MKSQRSFNHHDFQTLEDIEQEIQNELKGK